MATEPGSWQQVLEAHPELTQTAAGLYHLGTLALQSKQYGPARALLEAASAKDPWNKSLTKNLEFSRHGLMQAMGSTSAEASLYSARTDLEAFGDALGSPLGALGIGILLCMTALSAFRRSRISRSLRHSLKEPADWALLACLLMGAALSGVAGVSAARPPIYLLDKTSLRAGPASSFPEVGSVEGGAQARLLGRSADGKWVQLRFKPDAVGWAPREAFTGL